MLDKFEDVGTRISFRLKELNMTQRQLCDKTGISTNGVSQYVRNIRVPDTLSVYKLSIALETTIEWILTGEKSSIIPLKQSYVQESLNRDEQELIENFRKMDARDKVDLLDNARVKVNRQSKEPESLTSSNGKTNIRDDLVG